MIRCPKCGAGNTVGTLFCRNCGERLELDKVRPDVFHGRRSGPGGVMRGVRLAWKLFLLGVILFCVWTVAGFFRQPAEAPVPSLVPQMKDALQAKADAVFAPRPVSSRHSFTAAELTSLADGMLGLPVKVQDGSGLELVPEHLEVRVAPSGQLRVRLLSRAAGMTFCSTCSFAAEAAAEGAGVRFRPVEVQLGTVSLPRFAWPFVLKRVEPLLAGSAELQYVKAHGREFSVDGAAGTVEFVLPCVNIPPPPAACPRCKGSGKCPNSNCHGGRVNTPFGVESCTTCRGDGKCPSCKGTGKVAADAGAKKPSPEEAAANKALLSELEAVCAARDARKEQAAAGR